MSPVSSKKNVLNFEPGWKRPFSGRLNGVPTPNESAFALNAAVPSMAVSWIVFHFVSKLFPYVWSATWSADISGVCDASVISWFAALKTCSTCSLPLARSPGDFGT